jgi:prevent-host-death family protein
MAAEAGGRRIPATEARVRFGELLRAVEDSPVVVERGGKAVAVVLSMAADARLHSAVAAACRFVRLLG